MQTMEEILAGKQVDDPVLECLGVDPDPDTDFSDTLDWHDGIGTLPGSDIKVRILYTAVQNVGCALS